MFGVWHVSSGLGTAHTGTGMARHDPPQHGRDGAALLERVGGLPHQRQPVAETGGTRSSTSSGTTKSRPFSSARACAASLSARPPRTLTPGLELRLGARRRDDLQDEVEHALLDENLRRRAAAA